MPDNGEIFNEYLSQAHKPDGTLKNGIVTEAHLSPAVASKLSDIGATGPEGQQGPTGAQGPTGPQGPAGEPGASQQVITLDPVGADFTFDPSALPGNNASITLLNPTVVHALVFPATAAVVTYDGAELPLSETEPTAMVWMYVGTGWKWGVPNWADSTTETPGDTMKSPAAPEFDVAEHTLTIPADSGVQYALTCTGVASPIVADAGVWTVETGGSAGINAATKIITLASWPGTVYVTATAEPGYILTEPTEWQAEFNSSASSYQLAVPADAQYLFMMDDPVGTALPANSGTAGTTGIFTGSPIPALYGAPSVGAGLTSAWGGRLWLNGVLQSSTPAWTYAIVISAPCDSGKWLFTDGTMSTNHTDGTVLRANVVYTADWSDKFKIDYAFYNNVVRFTGPVTQVSGSIAGITQGEKVLIAATWDGTTTRGYIGRASGLTEVVSVADAGPVVTPVTYRVTEEGSNMIPTQFRSLEIGHMGGIVVSTIRAFSSSELEAMNAAVTR